MSYTILYNTMFLRSGEGITPCVLSGSNNCYDASNRRRDRSWSVFLNKPGTTEKEMLAAVEPWLGGYQEHWMRGGKWVDDAGLLRWVKSNAHNAYLLEDVLTENHLRSVNCCVSVWGTGYSYRREAEAICSTTQELDNWIRLSRKVIVDRKAAGEQAFPAIIFPRENIRRPQKCMLPDAPKVLLKHGNSYLRSYQADGVSWSRSIKDAQVFTREEADAIMDTCSIFSSIRNARVIDAARKELPYNAVIRIKSGRNAGAYLVRRVRGRIRLANNIRNAYHYADEKTAIAAMKKIQPSYPSCELEVLFDN